MKCTLARRNNQFLTGFQPDTVHATSPVPSSGQAPELSKNRPGSNHYGIGSDSGEATETANECAS